MKAVVAAFNQEKALVGAFSVITNLRMELFEALVDSREYLYFGNIGQQLFCLYVRDVNINIYRSGVRFRLQQLEQYFEIS